jgi:hypothetical protein
LLSGLWLFLSVVASFPFWHGWPESFSEIDWFSIAIIGMQFVFASAAVICWLTEPRRIIKEQRRILEDGCRLFH